MRTTHLVQDLFTLVFRLVEQPLEFGHGELFLDLDDVFSHGKSGPCVPLCALTAPVVESPAYSGNKKKEADAEIH
jgi:hypothetical protein